MPPNSRVRIRPYGQFLSTAFPCPSQADSNRPDIFFNNLACMLIVPGQKLPPKGYGKVGKTFLFSERREYSSGVRIVGWANG